MGWQIVGWHCSDGGGGGICEEIILESVSNTSATQFDMRYRKKRTKGKLQNEECERDITGIPLTA